MGVGWGGVGTSCPLTVYFPFHRSQTTPAERGPGRLLQDGPALNPDTELIKQSHGAVRSGGASHQAPGGGWSNCTDRRTTGMLVYGLICLIYFPLSFIFSQEGGRICTSLLGRTSCQIFIYYVVEYLLWNIIKRLNDTCSTLSAHLCDVFDEIASYSACTLYE